MFGKRKPVVRDVIFTMLATVEMMDRRWNPDQVAYVKKEHYDAAVSTLRALNRDDDPRVRGVFKTWERINECG